MQGDPLHAVEGLNQRARSVRDTAVRLEALRDRLRSDRVQTEVEISSLTATIEKLSQVEALFKELMDRLVVQQMRAVEAVVTDGFHSIFQDLDLSFEAEIAHRYGKVAIDLFIRQADKQDPFSYRGKPLEAFGGGPSSVASLILRVLTVARLKRWPLIVLDESLGAVSDEYVGQTGRFLQELARRMKIDVLLVTHKNAFLDHAHRAYGCSEVVQGEHRHLALRENKR